MSLAQKMTESHLTAVIYNTEYSRIKKRGRSISASLSFIQDRWKQRYFVAARTVCFS